MQCPNCGGRIGRLELAPNCKHCGVNIFYSQQEKSLTDDAKKCELEYATFHILLAKLKTAFIGGVIPVLRIVAMVLAIGAICVPFASVSVNLPLLSSKISFGAIGIYQAFSDGTLSALTNMEIYTPNAVWISIALLLLMVAIFVAGFVIFAVLLLSFIDIRKSAKIMRTMSAVGMLLSVASAAVSLLLPSVVSEYTLYNAKTGYGSFACVAVFILIFILNHLVIIKDIKPLIKEVDIRRVELRKKIKAGEVFLDDLPLPVFESEEEKTKRIEEESLKKSLADKARGGESGE